MSLSSLQLDAFHAVARTRNFSKAAKELHITQSALTQRVQNLEDELGLTLLVRNPRGIQTTPAGERLLRYCQARSALEAELFAELTGEGGDESGGLGGAVRLAAFSTVLRSVVIPALAPLLRANRRVQPVFLDAELRELPDVLLRGAADYVVVNEPLVRADLETLKLGDEENVLVESRDHATTDDLYLDHDPDDSTTAAFFAAQGAPPGQIRRGFYDDVYGIMDGVAQGLGRAVVPRHLALLDERLKIVRGYKAVKTPVYLQYFKQPFYTQLHEVTVGELTANAGALLKGR